MTTLPISEDDLKRTVIDMCRSLGLLVAHFRPAQIRPGVWVTPVEADGAGFVDLVIVGPGGVLFWELKSATGIVSADQTKWLTALLGAGAVAWVVRPRDLRSGAIEQELRALAKPRAALDQAEKETDDQRRRLRPAQPRQGRRRMGVHYEGQARRRTGRR